MLSIPVHATAMQSVNEVMAQEYDVEYVEAKGLEHSEVLPEFGRSVSRLKRQLSLLDGISVVVGIIMGGGIFMSPGIVLSDAGSVGLGILAWVAAGMVAICCALIYAELGSSIPVAGGDVHYYKLAFGDAVSFVYVWTMYFVVATGSLAIVATTFAQYVLAGTYSFDLKAGSGSSSSCIDAVFSSLIYRNQITPLSSASGGVDSTLYVKITAVACVAVLTFCNCLGVQVGSGLQNVFSLCKGLLVALLVAAAIAYVIGDTTIAQRNLYKPFSGSAFPTFGPAMVAALYAFCGWGDIVFLAEEMKDPVKDVPRAAIGGISIIAGIYLLVNVSYLCVLPAPDIMNSSVVAVDMAISAVGPWAGMATGALVAVSLLGSANGIALVGGRYLYAAGRDGHIFHWFGCLGQRSKAPVTALIAQGVWCSVLLLQSSSLVELLSYFGTASFFFYGLTALALMKLRRDFPDLHRPFTIKFYPYGPIIVICVAMYLVLSSLMAYPVPTSLAFGFMLTGFPVYLLYSRFGKALSSL